MQKSYKSAICLIPPGSVWPQLQAVRVFNDKAYVRWPPHINLLNPFYADEGPTLAQAAASCVQALASVQPFEVGSSGCETFEIFVLGTITTPS